MGTMTRLFGGEGSDAISGKNEKLSAPTDASAITPLNPGTFATIRTSPVVDAPRYFSKEEADAMKELAKEKTESARYAKKAYKSLTQIERLTQKFTKPTENTRERKLSTSSPRRKLMWA